jgi:protein-tyrosine phosphatase
MKNIFSQFLSFLFLFFVCNSTLAEKIEILFYDVKEINKEKLPRNFRDLSSLNLNAIASGQFSENELALISKKYPNQKIIIVDLRRENHGFINGEPVVWQTPFHQVNSNKKISEIIQKEQYLLNFAKNNQKIIINKTLEKDEEKGWYKSIEPQITDVKSVASEKDLAKKYGFEYKRFSVQDYQAPDLNQLKAYVKFINNLPKDKKIYVHCAAGRGRTTTFLAIYDILKNGDQFTLDEILERQYKIGGVKLNEIDEKYQWRLENAEKRLKVIQDFYNQNKKDLK